MTQTAVLVREALATRLDALQRATPRVPVAVSAGEPFEGFAGTDRWYSSPTPFRAALERLARGEAVQVAQTAAVGCSTGASDLADLAAVLEVPVNFSFDPLGDVREEALRLLMVRDRHRNPADIATDELVQLRLELVTLHSTRCWDLRFLDAANLFFERLGPQIAEVPVFAGLYARCLVAWTERL